MDGVVIGVGDDVTGAGGDVTGAGAVITGIAIGAAATGDRSISVTGTGNAGTKERRRLNAAVAFVFSSTASLGGRPEYGQREAGGLSLLIGGLPDRFTS